MNDRTALHEKAYEVASEGKSNAEIFAELEISSGALQKMLMSDPHLVFNIVQGRARFLEPIVQTVADIGQGEANGRAKLSALKVLLERADANNKILMLSHELLFLQGLISIEDKQRMDSAMVTELLRKKSA